MLYEKQTYATSEKRNVGGKLMMQNPWLSEEASTVNGYNRQTHTYKRVREGLCTL